MIRFPKPPRNLKKALLIGGAAAAGTGLLCAGGAAIVVSEALRRRQKTKLTGKVVLITGSSRGLGLALAEEFGKRGARLVLTARDPWELDRARQALVERGAVRSADDVLVIPADLREAEEAKQVVERATAHFGRVDVLVNNAGVITVGPVENQRIEDFHDVMDSNFFTGIHCAMSVLPQMLERRSGTIVNITSIGGKIPVPHMLPYTASKFAAVGFSEGLHAELRAKGVHVLTVCPGLIRTGSHLNALFSGDAQREYRWFSVSANMPGLAASAAAAARRIVNATIAGRTEIAITPHAAVAARLASVAPEAIAVAMSVANRLLPKPVPATAGPRPGAEVQPQNKLPPIGRATARKYNQTA
ncbi:MAG TPA: SDR family NAD(P)-dependent oxidoreductase [Acidobacteriaceae bacterium]